MQKYNVPPVALPGVDQAVVAQLAATVSETHSRRARFFLALRRTGKHIYAGNADPVVVARRRAANKVARKSRKANR